MIQHMNFGPVQLGWHLDGQEPHWRDFLAAYSDYAQPAEIDFHIHASVLPTDPEAAAPVMPNTFMHGRLIQGDDFTLGGGLVAGRISADDACTCDIHPVLLHGCGLRVLEQFFYLLFQHVVALKFGRNADTPFLLHCSAATTDRGAMLFCGPSGNGKSTIAANCPPGSVLTDECAVIQPGADRFMISGSPVNPFCAFKSPGTHPLSELFLISHGLRNEIFPASTLATVPRLAAEIMVPLGLMETDLKTAMARAMDSAIRLKNALQVKELKFLPNNTFWNLVTGKTASGQRDR